MSLLPCCSSSSRRSIGRTSMAPGSLPGYGPPIKKDTRPVNDRNFRNVMEERLGEFIRQTNFSIPGLDTTKRITEPTQSSFVGMFKHIYAECIDPKYTFGLENKKFEEEVIMLMREARYPFADELSKTRLQAAGSRTNWPPILAMLDWMINLGVSTSRPSCSIMRLADLLLFIARCIDSGSYARRRSARKTGRRRRRHDARGPGYVKAVLPFLVEVLRQVLGQSRCVPRGTRRA